VPQALQQVVLPQALRIALPATVGQFISLLQDTTLLSLIRPARTARTARTVMANPDFLGLTAEVYLTLAVPVLVLAAPPWGSAAGPWNAASTPPIRLPEP